MKFYERKSKSYYRKMFPESSDILFTSAWKQYLGYLNGAIDNPKSDEDVYDWIDSIISEKVNNNCSSFYIHG